MHVKAKKPAKVRVKTAQEENQLKAEIQPETLPSPSCACDAVRRESLALVRESENWRGLKGAALQNWRRGCGRSFSRVEGGRFGSSYRCPPPIAAAKRNGFASCTR